MVSAKNVTSLAIAGVFGFLSVACGGSKDGAKDASDSKGASGAKVERVAGVDDTIARFKEKDPTIVPLFAQSAGFFIVPTLGEGGFIIGGGHGNGEAFEGGAYVGHVSVSELSIGAQVGGQSYSELVFFEKPRDFARLKENSFQFNAEVTAVAAKKGAAKNSSFKDGTVAFVLPKAGLMAAAAVSGQKITFTAAK